MELFILNPNASNYDMSVVVDDYHSLVWTERWQDIGDFELILDDTSSNRNRFALSNMFVHQKSSRVMMVETLEGRTDSDDQPVLVVSGRSIELVFKNRVVRSALDSLVTWPNYIRNDTAFGHVMYLPAWLLWTGSNRISSSDVLPNTGNGSVYNNNNSIATSSNFFRITPELENIYDVIRPIALAHNLGFRFMYRRSVPDIVYDAYTGRDLTITQTVHTPVEFSPALDTFRPEREFISIADAYRYIYVFNTNDTMTGSIRNKFYGSSWGLPATGWARRTKGVRGTRAMEQGSYAESLLEMWIRVGEAHLAEHSPKTGIDGEVLDTSAYIYDEDYRLGDRVTIRNTRNQIFTRRVAEYIFIVDENGERGYPTFVEER